LNQTMIKTLICPNCKKQTIELIEKVTPTKVMKKKRN